LIFILFRFKFSGHLLDFLFITSQFWIFFLLE